VSPDKRRPFKKRKYSPNTMTTMRHEMKFKDFNIKGTNLVAAALDKVNLCDIAGGTGRDERIGNKILIKKIGHIGLLNITRI